MKYNHENQSGLYRNEEFLFFLNNYFILGDSTTTLTRLLNSNENDNTRSSTMATSQFQINQSKV